MPTVLITRPNMLAAPLIERCRALGAAVMHEPLLTIAPLAALRPALPIKPVVLITSRVTFEVMASRKRELLDLLHAPLYCVGEKTADAARAFGFTDLRRAAPDSQTLADVLRRQEQAATPLLHIGGQERETAFYETLTAAGFSLLPWIVYRADPAAAFSESLIGALMHHKIDAALFFSPRTARIFAGLIRLHGLEACCPALIAIGLSAAVLDALSGLTFKASLIAPHPTETDMLGCLNRALNTG